MKKYFLIQIKGNAEAITEKGVVVKDTLEDARQSFHAYLGAYGYGHDKNIFYVNCMIIDMDGRVTDSIVDNRIPEVLPEVE